MGVSLSQVGCLCICLIFASKSFEICFESFKIRSVRPAFTQGCYGVNSQISTYTTEDRTLVPDGIQELSASQ